MTRDDAIWYYVLGRATLGPVAWSEIEALTRDAFDAEDLLVARAGDPEWRSAKQMTEEFPELAAKPDEPAPEAEEPPAPERAPVGMPAAPAAPVAAPASVAAAPPVGAVAAGVGGAFVPVHGLGQWIGQAWEMVIRDIWPWVGGVALMMLVGSVTLGIASPPLTTGLYMMALKRYRGGQLGATDVFQGFGRFLSSWGLALLTMIPALLLMAPFMILMVIPIMQAQGEPSDEVAVGAVLFVQLLIPVISLLVMAVQTIFFYSWVLVAEGYGAWESVTMSYDRVRTAFWSYFGTYVAVSFLASLGSYACYVGLLVSWPLLPCAQVAAYMWHFRRVQPQQ